jgi:hypothetical protein
VLIYYHFYKPERLYYVQGTSSCSCTITNCEHSIYTIINITYKISHTISKLTNYCSVSTTSNYIIGTSKKVSVTRFNTTNTRTKLTVPPAIVTTKSYWSNTRSYRIGTLSKWGGTCRSTVFEALLISKAKSPIAP